MLSHCKGLHHVVTIPTTTPNTQQQLSPQRIPISSLKWWFTKSQELKAKTKATGGSREWKADKTLAWRAVWSSTKPLQRRKCLRGKMRPSKIFGTGGKKEDRVLLLQGQDFWGMEEGGRSHTQSFTQEHMRSLSNTQGLQGSLRSSHYRSNKEQAGFGPNC